MKIAGIIVEFNPMHNGHQYLIQRIQEIEKPDIIIAVMSGNFLQRGEPSIVSKWLRTEMALTAGIDVVLELPYHYAVGHANLFARGAISILSECGVTDLYFGSESGDIASFYHTARHLRNEKNNLDLLVQEKLQQGYSYPKAYSLAYTSTHTNEMKLLDLSEPNNILGLHYVKVIQELHSSIKAHTILRKGAQHHDQSPHTHTEFASGTGIRNALMHGNDFIPIRDKMPNESFKILMRAVNQNQILGWNDFFPLLKYRLMSSSIEELASIYESEEGLEFRAMKAIKETNDFFSFISLMKSKRYTWTRLQRYCCHILLNVSKQKMKSFLETPQTPYLRLLGMSLRGQRYLRCKKGSFSVPLISNVKKSFEDLLRIDIRSADVYDMKTSYSEKKSKPLRYDQENQRFL
ncbi:nucleotidyltransferase [Terrilactibacillus laevilacticus]|uniref:tRNA(Met) cytidine acetate ligase n=1 Tax=Terrilactibacillus laevilacticus TaxID=1380157 RepID=A0ABW5PQ61_9BACI|nr:nucleotidyltransferase [Terrilactibacillus laevilacticus]